jgi:membrane protein YdbS with pleckstrin-like domain
MEPTSYKISGAWVIATILLWLAAGIFAAFTVVVPIIAVILIGRAILIYLTMSVILDAHGITWRQRFITTEEKRFPISNIHAVSTSVGPIGSQFDYGTIALSVGNDRQQIKIGNLGGCRDLKQKLDELMSK